MRTDWECVIGLEIHVQLNTASKIFSGASTAFGAEPNSQACPVDLGLPGVLPVLNERVVEMAVAFGLAVRGNIAERCRFDRKNYFYPDLPKGYQISQLDEPIVSGGTVEIEDDGGDRGGGIDGGDRGGGTNGGGGTNRGGGIDVDGGMDEGTTKRIRLTRAHLEEDAGKSLHDAYQGKTGIDLNRAGTPLLEVVTEPEIASPREAANYFRALHALVRYLDICDGNLNEGSMRCDANVSIRPRGSDELGERTEIKNINSFRFVERALEVEIDRQIDVLEGGGDVVRETLLYDPDRDETRPMRGKESSEDYRYFPDPDLLPVAITPAMRERAEQALPELPTAKRVRYVDELGLDAKAAARIIASPVLARYFEEVAAASGNAKLAANWILADVAAALNRAGDEDIRIPAASLGTLIARIEDDTISSKIAKALFEVLWNEGGDVDDLIEKQGLKQVSDVDALESMVRAVLAKHPDQVAAFRGGKTKLMGFFVGQIMQATDGKANPRQVNELLQRALSE